MPPLRQVFVVIASSLAAMVATQAAHGATRIELPIDEVREKRTVPWPITTGVPFARGALARAEHCRLIDDLGEEQPLQTKIAATWDAQRSSIRWLTIDFIAQPGRKYALEFGTEVRAIAFPQTIAIRDGDDVVVNAGALDIEFSKRGTAGLGSVRVDLNGDGKIAPEEIIARGAKEGDHTFTNQRQEISTGARDEAQRQIVIESTGPVRACIRVDGWYTGPQGERTVAYRTRYHLFAGLSLLKIIDEFRIVGSTRDVQFADIALSLEIPSLGAAIVENPTRPTSGARSRTLKLKLPCSSAQTTYRHYGNLESESLLVSADETLRWKDEVAPPWMQYRGDGTAVTGSLRHFWQQFPKEWEAKPNRLSLHLWSPRVAPLDFGEAGLKNFFGPAGAKYLLDWQAIGNSTPISDFFYHAGRHALRRDGADGKGINKHHEVWFHFGAASQSDQGQEYGALADAQPLCLPTGAWNVGTGVFGPLAARPNNSPYEAIVDRIFELERYAQDAFGDYGWFLFGAGPHYSYQWDKEAQRHYADPRRFEYHTYQRETQLWWNYLRSGERKFYDWAIPSENHWVDVAVSHVPTKYSTEWRGGARQEASLHYAAGDWSIDSPLHYVRHHDTGEAWLRSAPQLWASYHRTLETTTLAYFLTGDERYNDVIGFWKNYWGSLAGVRSDSVDVAPWYREQLWWQPTQPGEPAKTWAEMIRDYAPFQSGSRHQMTLFFNLSTLYEHTWDPKVGQAVREFADAYLAPENPNGVWQCQDHRLPANADSPMLAHYWSPALWKYDRATGDPRMREVLPKYFTACIEADPYGEDVGIYSNVQIAWAWHFTRDPRHLAAAKHELQELLPNAAPLDRPEDLNRRIYNPYAPIKALAAVPRLIGILQEADQSGVEVPPLPRLTPQRTWIGIRRRDNETMQGTLWGWDDRVGIYDEAGHPAGEITANVTHRSHRQPFDRAVSGYRVFRQEFTVAPTEQAAWCFLQPRLETGILQLSSPDTVWCWAGMPINVMPRETWFWRRPTNATEVTIDSAQPAVWTVCYGERALPVKTAKNRAVFSLVDVPEGALLTITTATERGAWFRVADAPADAVWISPSDPRDQLPPSAPPALSGVASATAIDESQTFVEGRFGRGLLVAAGRELRIPDEIVMQNGKSVRLTDVRQGTIEFWIRRLWDQRVTSASVQTVITSGGIYAPLPDFLPYNEWAHVAVVWHPIPNDELGRSLVHVYVDGVDYGNYRSIYWQGYAQPPTFSPQKDRQKHFVLRGTPGASFVIDDIRFSSRPRYLDPTLGFGKGQTFNPKRFEPPSKPLEVDDETNLHFPLDGDFNDRGKNAATAILLEKK